MQVHILMRVVTCWDSCQLSYFKYLIKGESWGCKTRDVEKMVRGKSDELGKQSPEWKTRWRWSSPSIKHSPRDCAEWKPSCTQRAHSQKDNTHRLHCVSTARSFSIKMNSRYSSDQALQIERTSGRNLCIGLPVSSGAKGALAGTGAGQQHKPTQELKDRSTQWLMMTGEAVGCKLRSQETNVCYCVHRS